MLITFWISHDAVSINEGKVLSPANNFRSDSNIQNIAICFTITPCYAIFYWRSMQIYKYCDYTSINWKVDGLKFSFNILYLLFHIGKIVPSAVNIQYTWLRKIDNFLLYIVYIYIIYIYCILHIYCLSISFVFQFIILKGNDSNTLKLKTHDESNARFNTIFNISCSYFEDTISTNFKRYTRHLTLPFGCAS